MTSFRLFILARFFTITPRPTNKKIVYTVFGKTINLKKESIFLFSSKIAKRFFCAENDEEVNHFLFLTHNQSRPMLIIQFLSIHSICNYHIDCRSVCRWLMKAKITLNIINDSFLILVVKASTTQMNNV